MSADNFDSRIALFRRVFIGIPARMPAVSHSPGYLMLNHTPLHSLHQEMGGKLVDFSGWSMPVNYGSQIEEHHAVRRDAGMFDVSHMTIVDVRGTQAKTFLQYLLANDVAKLQTP